MSMLAVPNAASPSHRATPPGGGRLVVLGGGASAVALLVGLECLGTDRPVTVVEPAPVVGPGRAYVAPAHLLLNAPADTLGIDATDPGGFARWARAADGAAFLPRALYGRYLEDRFRNLRLDVDVVREAATGLVRTPSGAWGIVLASGRTLTAEEVVLALGDASPARLPVARNLGSSWIRDPWAPGALDTVGPDEDVLVLGTGLTAADVVLTLTARGHRGRIGVVSRDGRWPLPHPAAPVRDDTPPLAPGHTPQDLLTRVLTVAADPEAAAGWADEARRALPEVWAAWTTADRRWFLRHALRPWNRVRHRIPREIAARLLALEEEGTVGREAGTIAAVLRREGKLAVTIVGPRRPDVERVVDRVVQCTGPDLSPVGHGALVTALLRDGIVRADPNDVGLDVDEGLRLLDAHGLPHPDLRALGPLTRPAAWETVSIPEIVAQASRLAESLRSSAHAGGRR